LAHECHHWIFIATDYQWGSPQIESYNGGEQL